MTSARRQLIAVHLALLTTAVLWGGNFTALKYLLDRLKPIDALLIRVGGAALFFAVILLVDRRPRRRLTRPDAVRFLGLGLIGITIMNIAFVYGQSMIPATLASLVVTSNPIHTAVISRFLGGEPLTARKIGGIALAMAGFLIVLFFGSPGGASLGGGEIKGMLLVAIGPFAWAFYTVLSKPMLERYSPIETSAYTAFAGSVGLIPFLYFDHGIAGRLQDLSARGWIAAVYLAALGFVLAYILWYRGLRVLSPSQTAVYIYLVPVFGLICARVVLGEAITRYIILGAVTILAGVVVTNTARTPQRVATAELLPSPSAD
jgi:drug/metabolite transporter (DMT)-like permease